MAALFAAPMFWINYAQWLDIRFQPGREQKRDAHRRRFVVSLVITVVAVVLGALIPRHQ